MIRKEHDERANPLQPRRAARDGRGADDDGSGLPGHDAALGLAVSVALGALSAAALPALRSRRRVSSA